MHLHTFRGPTIAQTLLSVKKALGKDAVIVHTRSFKVGGMMGVGGKETIEITALAATPATPASPADVSARPVAPPGRLVAPSPQVPATRAGAAPEAAASSAARVSAARPDPSQVMRVRRRGLLAGSDPESRARDHDTPRETADPPGLGAGSIAPACTEARDDVRHELRDIRAMLHRALAHAPAQPPLASVEPAPSPVRGADQAPLPPALFDRHVRLLQQHVSRELADGIARRVRDTLQPHELDDQGAVDRAILQHLVHLIPVSRSSVTPRRAPDGSPFSIALVGPTGVGKTSTIAKLAAAYTLHQRLRVAVISTDTSRPGASEQMHAYARLIGVPFAVAPDAASLSHAITEFADADVILIDTFGVPTRNPRHADRLAGALQGVNISETHLVLAGTMSEHAMLAAARSLASLAPSRVLFTKLDEAVTYGVVLSVAAALKSHLSFLTHGQELEGDIEAPRIDRLADLVLSGAAPTPDDLVHP
ncbi:MAG: flagellar biosynthesis protein FlhF [Phycisphaerales bacterium]